MARPAQRVRKIGLHGGQNTLATPKPVTDDRQLGHATTLYDYINRAMPFNAPQSLTPDEVYSVIAWLLFQNQIIAEDAVMDARTLPESRDAEPERLCPGPGPDVH